MDVKEIKMYRVTSTMVAEHAGVSQATVSRVLNDLPVDAGTATRVRAAMQELGYVPRKKFSTNEARTADIHRYSSPGCGGLGYSKNRYLTSLAVAEKAGVSASTISRVINNRPVDIATAVHVRRVMQEMGYIPRPAVLRQGPQRCELRGLRTGMVAFLARGENLASIVRSPVMVNVIHGVESALAERGLTMVHGALDSSKQHLPPAIIKRQVDGIIVWPNLAGISDDSIEALRPYPVVYLMNTPEDRLLGDRVRTNNRSVGMLAAKHLAAHGHRHLAYVTSPDMLDSVYERWQAFAKVTREYGGTARQHVVGMPHTNDRKIIDASIEQGVHNLLDTQPRPTGILVTSDELTARIYRPLKARGIKIGSDLEIISCNNEYPILEHLDPRPLSIDIGAEEIGRKAVDRLIWRIQNPTDNGRITVEIEPHLDQ